MGDRLNNLTYLKLAINSEYFKVVFKVLTILICQMVTFVCVKLLSA